jgi:hypothetical protein
MGKAHVPMKKSFTVLITIEEESKGNNSRICEELELGRFDSEEAARECMTEILEDAGYEEEETDAEEEETNSR